MSETRTALELGTAQLRPIREEDAPDLQYILSDPRVYEPTSYDVLDLEGTRALLTKWLANERAGVARRWAVAGVQGEGALLGTCGFHRIDPKHRVAELGYEINPALWGRGLATWAVGRAVRWAFTDSAIRRIEAVVWVENAASVRVLEKCGFEREGCLRGYRLCRGVPRDFYAYALLRPQVVDAPANPPLQPTGSACG